MSETHCEIYEGRPRLALSNNPLELLKKETEWPTKMFNRASGKIGTEQTYN
jgi:hypothetical protein